jgi:hypothetical protein
MTKLDLVRRLARESSRTAAEAADVLDEAVQRILKSAQAENAPLFATNKGAQAADRGDTPTVSSTDLVAASESVVREALGGRRRGRRAATNKPHAGPAKGRTG